MIHDGDDESTRHDGPADADDRASAEGTRGGSTRRRSSRRLALVATGTTIALGAGGIAYAATTEPTPTPSLSTPEGTTPLTPPTEVPDGTDRPDGAFGHHGGGMFFGGPGGMALHGEQVVETEDGVYETIATQRGTVDEVSDDEVTVSSEDGYSRTYVLTADALTFDGPEGSGTVELELGDEVMLVATVESGTATVTRVIDISELPALVPGEGRPGWGRGGHDGELPGNGTTEGPETEGSSA